MHYRITGPIDSDDEDQVDAFNRMPYDKDDEILIEISSMGGGLDALMMYLNRIHEAKANGKRIITWASGPALSAAATILWQGHQVYVSPVSAVMFHNSVDTVIHGPLDLIWIKCLEAWHRYKTGKVDDFSTFTDRLFATYEPWDLILKSYGDKVINGDYYFTSHEFATLKPEKIKVGTPKHGLKLFTGAIEDEEEIIEAIKEAEAEAIVEEVDDEEYDEDEVEEK